MTKFNICFDKRFEILQGIVIAFIEKYQNLKDDYDWVEIFDCQYVKDLIAKINIDKYPIIIDYIKSITDCGYYSELFLYFDQNMNFYSGFNKKAFKKGSNNLFAKELKKLYDNENLESFFQENIPQLNNLIEPVKKDLKIIDLEKLNEFYDYKNQKYNVLLSFLANGGFGFKKGNDLWYFRGLKYVDNQFVINKDTLIVCLFHEYSHPKVNKLVDKCFNMFDKIKLEKMYNEAIINGLSKCYQKKKTFLYEYFVRANAIFLAKDYVSYNYLIDEINWTKRIGFIYIEKFIELIESKKGKYNNIFLDSLIPFFNNII